MRAVHPHALFVYGTLRDPAVQQAFFGREVPGAAAVLEGWAVYASEEDGFLFIKPGPSYRVFGLVLNLSDLELHTADAWEDVPLYQRERVTVIVGGQSQTVWTYTRRHASGPKHDGESFSGHQREHVIAWARQLRLEMAGRLKA